MAFIQKLFGRESGGESLQGEMYRLDVVEDLLREAIRVYQSLMDSIAAHAPGGMLEQSREVRDRSADYKKKLKQTRNLLNAKPSKPLLVEVSQQLERALESYNKDLDAELNHHAREAKQVMAIVAVMAESMADRESQYNVRFRGIGKKLRVLTTSNDLGEIRRKLEAEVSQLEKYVDEMSRDTESAVSRVQMELRRPPSPVQAAASGVEEPGKSSKVGRREAEQAIESRRRSDNRFCAARFNVANLNEVAAKFGLPVAAGLMDQLAERIASAFADPDKVYRWSDLDLLVVSEQTLPELAGRISEIEQSLNAPFMAGSRQVRLNIRSCVIERMYGETGAETRERIDGMLTPVES